MKTIYVGIDISAKTLDICVKDEYFNSFIIQNNFKSIAKFFKTIDDSSELVIAMENTGIYNWELYSYLKDKKAEVYVICPIHMSKSFGLTREKNDKVDARRICQFIIKNQNESRQWKPTPDSIQVLKILLTERNGMIKEKRQINTRQNNYSRMRRLGIDKKLTALSNKRVSLLDKQIEIIEKEIQSLVEEDQLIKEQVKLITSIQGVGKVLTWHIIAKTEGFTRINEAKKMACYSGVAPFGKSSGTSFYRKPKVSVFADKQMKSILHMAAMSAINHNYDLKIYYQRKVAEGKNKMAVLNAVRNKLIHRVFAVIKNNKPYVNNLDLS